MAETIVGQLKGLLTERMSGAKGGSCPTCGAAMADLVDKEPVRGSGRRKVGINRGNSILSPTDEEKLGG